MITDEEFESILPYLYDHDYDHEQVFLFKRPGLFSKRLSIESSSLTPKQLEMTRDIVEDINKRNLQGVNMRRSEKIRRFLS